MADVWRNGGFGVKYNQLTQPSDSEFTPWVTPRKEYRLACCDCGLVHDVEFFVLLKGGKKLDRRKVYCLNYSLQRDLMT